MYIIMDMGTTHTRLWLQQADKTVASSVLDFGAGKGRFEGREALYSSLRKALLEFIGKYFQKEKDIECIITSGMAGSEFGISETNHILIPAGAAELANYARETVIPEITVIPFVIIPGLKKTSGDKYTDMMCGEETETLGILQSSKSAEDAVIMLPGTHNKLIKISEGIICDFVTTMSGEILNSVITGTILRGQVSHDFSVCPVDVLQGADYAQKNGLNAALFKIRVMAKNGIDNNALSSFLYGAVLCQDLKLIEKFTGNKRLFIGGGEKLRQVYALLTQSFSSEQLPELICENAVKSGLCEIYKLRKNIKFRNEIIKSIEKNRIISIIRNPVRDTLIPAVRALFNGGIRLVEVTFDRSGKHDKQYTAEIISELCNEFSGKLTVGAGTVMSCEEVLIAYQAGAQFIISPNCDPEVIKLTRRLGLVSIPAAFTPSEIAQATRNGADFVKIFPADALSENYIKSVSAPISDVKLFAVGGVTTENIKSFLNSGFYGVGVGTGLYNSNLIANRQWKELTLLAKQFTLNCKCEQ